MLLSRKVSLNKTMLLSRKLSLNKTMYKKSLSQMFYKTDVLNSFTIFTGEHLCRSLFIKKILRPRCFLVKIANCGFFIEFFLEMCIDLYYYKQVSHLKIWLIKVEVQKYTKEKTISFQICVYFWKGKRNSSVKPLLIHHRDVLGVSRNLQHS